MNLGSLLRGRGRSIVSSADVLANSLDPDQCVCVWGGGEGVGPNLDPKWI